MLENVCGQEILDAWGLGEHEEGWRLKQLQSAQNASKNFAKGPLGTFTAR